MRIHGTIGGDLSQRSEENTGLSARHSGLQ